MHVAVSVMCQTLHLGLPQPRNIGLDQTSTLIAVCAELLYLTLSSVDLQKIIALQCFCCIFQDLIAAMLFLVKTRGCYCTMQKMLSL